MSTKKTDRPSVFSEPLAEWFEPKVTSNPSVLPARSKFLAIYHVTIISLFDAVVLKDSVSVP